MKQAPTTEPKTQDTQKQPATQAIEATPPKDGKGTKKILIISGIIVAVLALATGAYFFITPFLIYGQYGREYTAAGKPVSAKYQLDPAATSHFFTDKAGGQVERGDLTLDIPQNALAGREEIVVKKISSMSELPNGWKFIDGYEFSPDGTVFAQPATANLNLKSTNKVYAFKINDGRLTRVPMVKTKDGFSVPVNSFSGIAFIQISGDVPSAANSNEIELKSKEIIANIVSENNEEVTDAQRARIKNVLDVWYNTSVKKHLVASANNDSTLRSSISEYLAWLSYAQFFGVDDNLIHQTNEGRSLIAKGLANAVKIASAKCSSNTDITQVAAMITWQSISQLLGLDDEVGLSDKGIQQKIKNCASFELKFDSRIDTQTSAGSSFITAQGTAQIGLNDEGNFVGTGTFTEGPLTQGSCQFSVNGSNHNFKVGETALNPRIGTQPGVNINLLFDLTEAAEFDAHYVCDINGSTFSFTMHSPQWVVDFDSVHYDDAGAAYANSANYSYIISDWEYVGSGGIVAKKALKGTDSTMGVTTVSNTNFTLYHRPK